MWDELVCPLDHGRLERHGDWLSCCECGGGYPLL